MTSEPISIGAFIRAMADRFKQRAELGEREALAMAAACIEAWEDMGDLVEMTEECARSIVDSELEYWEAA